MLNPYRGKENTKIQVNVNPKAGTNIEFNGTRYPHSGKKEE